jgi:hypothetical protein
MYTNNFFFFSLVALLGGGQALGLACGAYPKVGFVCGLVKFHTTTNPPTSKTDGSSENFSVLNRQIE